jgi:Mg/Co/Ni transporter MgtE
LVDNQLKFIETKPDINSYFSWVDTKLASESIWKDISKYNLWNFIDDSKIDSLVNICDEITYDNGFEVFKLLTKDKIIELKYDDPYGKIKNCKFNQTRADIIKIKEIIYTFFKSK